MKPILGVKKSRSRICSYRCLFFSGLVVMTLLFTALFTRVQPNLLAASKIQVVDRASNVFRPSVSADEFQLDTVDDDDNNAEEATTRAISVPKGAVKGIRANANTGRPPLPDSVKPFQVDAFEALRMYGSATTLPTTGNNRKESKDTKQNEREKKGEKARPQRNKKAANNIRANTREGGLPQVAWIMSFGGSVSEMHQVHEWAVWLFLSKIEHALPGI
jgi:hypothetical protein